MYYSLFNLHLIICKQPGHECSGYCDLLNTNLPFSPPVCWDSWTCSVSFSTFLLWPRKAPEGRSQLSIHDITTDITTVRLVCHIYVINSFLLMLKHWLAYDDLPPSWNFTEQGKLHFSGLGTPPKETNYAFCQVWSSRGIKTGLFKLISASLFLILLPLLLIIISMGNQMPMTSEIRE